MRSFPAAILVANCLAAGPLLAEGRSIIVLDGSGSMWGQIGGRAKLEIAREALGTVLSGLDPATEIGLMAYGHREKGSCEDIELVVPPGAGTAQAITDAANAMRFLGKTPLTEAVRRAAGELRSTEEAATVILITDGIETCEADPCALGAELEASGVDFTAHVVGFGLTEEEGRAVACLAENTGGRYIQASDATGLVDALQTAVAEPEPLPEPEPAVLAENVDPVLRLVAGGEELEGDLLAEAAFEFLPVAADGTVGEPVATIYGASLGFVPAGRYLMRATLHKAMVEQEIDVTETELLRPEAVLDAGVLSLKILAEEGGDPAPGSAWEVQGAGGVGDYGYEQALRVLPSGEYELSATLGEMSAKEAIVISAGEVLEKTVILGVGVAVLNAFYAPGVPVEGSQTFDIYEARTALDGSRKSVRTDYGAGSDPELPPGDYIVVASVDEAEVEQPFTVLPGQRVAVDVVLNAGIAAIRAPNARSIEIFEARMALDGSRKSLRTSYGEEAVSVLPAGDYIVVATTDEASGEASFSVKAAERTELTVTMPAGLAAINAPGATQIEIFGASAGLDGDRPRIRSSYGEASETMLPPGDYVAEARADKAVAETAFTVKDGERTEVTVVIQRGVIAVSAPGARAIAIHGPVLSASDKPRRISGDYGETSESTLAPGDYIARVDFGDDVEVDQPFTLADGQRLELAVTKP